MVTTIQIDPRTWRIEDDGVRIFLLEGDSEALVIDSGMHTPNAREIVEGITKLPFKLINTHADIDHISGNDGFPEIYMTPVEWEDYKGERKTPGTLLPVADGDIIDLGGRKLKIIDLAGHTRGSIAILDIGARVLFGGDSIQDGSVFMFGERRSMPLYVKTMEALWENHREEFDLIYPSHMTFPLKPELIPKLIAGAKDVLAGKVVGKPTKFMDESVVLYDIGCAGFLCEKQA